MLLFHGKDGFQQASCCRVLVVEVLDDVTIAFDGDTFRNEILLDHFEERSAFNVFSMAAAHQPFWRKIRFAVQQDNAFRQLIGIATSFLARTAAARLVNPPP